MINPVASKKPCKSVLHVIDMWAQTSPQDKRVPCGLLRLFVHTSLAFPKRNCLSRALQVSQGNTNSEFVTGNYFQFVLSLLILPETISEKILLWMLISNVYEAFYLLLSSYLPPSPFEVFTVSLKKTPESASKREGENWEHNTALKSRVVLIPFESKNISTDSVWK